MKFININDKYWLNPEKISYVYRNDFLKGTIVLFDNMVRQTFVGDEERELMRELKKRGFI